MRSSALLALSLSLFSFTSYTDQVLLSLRNGSSIQAELIKEATDAVFLDLGEEIIRIPRASIRSMDAADPDTAGTEQRAFRKDDTRLFHTRTDVQDDTVENWAKRLGEAVVEIRSRVGQGSGFLLNDEGYLITNYHVIALDRKLTVTVFANDNGELEKIQYQNIRIVAMDPIRDLALLRIEDETERPFAWVPVGDSSTVATGESVFAIGSPLGLDRTVSRGIISLADRYMGGRLLLQTTTQINPGNSGGPLLNLAGEVVGVNTLKIASTGIEGVSFAVPSNAVKTFLESRTAYAFDPRNPNVGFHYLTPPRKSTEPSSP